MMTSAFKIQLLIEKKNPWTLRGGRREWVDLCSTEGNRLYFDTRSEAQERVNLLYPDRIGVRILEVGIESKTKNLVCEFCRTGYPANVSEADFEGNRRHVCDDCLETCKQILIQRGEVQPIWRR